MPKTRCARLASPSSTSCARWGSIPILTNSRAPTRRLSSRAVCRRCRRAPRPGSGSDVAGRIRAIRNSGMFIDLHDASGKIQVFSHKDYLARRVWRW